MSERPNDQPTEDDLEPNAADDAAGAAPDDAGDRGADAIDADAAEALADDELEADGLEDDEPTVEAGDAALLAAADEEALPDVTTGAGAIPAATQTRPMRPSERRAMRSALDHGQLTIDPAHRVSDRASAVFVLVAVGVFVVILLNGLVLGHGGFLTPIPTPSPVPSLTASPVPSATVVPSGSVVPSPTVAPSVTPAVTSPPPSETPGAS